MKTNLNAFDLDFDTPEETTNIVISEKNLYDILVRNGFIFSNEPITAGAGYIMSEGKYLFLELNKDLLDTSGISTKITHGALDFYLIDHKYIQPTEATRILCQTDNAIRINDGTNFGYEVLIGLPQYKISPEQAAALETWLYYLLNKNKTMVQVGNELVSSVFQTYNLKEQSPEEIVKKILNYYNNGILREATEIKHLEDK